MPLKACLDRLSPELLIPIMKALPDLGSLSNLLLASPTAYRVFSSHAVGAVEIFEACLSGGLLHSHTCALIRIASQVRSGTLPSYVSGRQSLFRLLRFETTTWRYTSPEWEYPASRVPSSTSASTLRKLLATYRKIERLTYSCLEFYLQRFRPLRPRQVADKNFCFTNKNYGEGSDSVYVPSWQQKPVEIPVVVRDVGAPSWVEEQRVTRAFWRVQLLCDLQIAAEEGRINWPEAELRNLNKLAVVDLYDVDAFRVTGQKDMDPEDSENTPFLRDQGTLLEHELIFSVVDYVNASQSVNQTGTLLHSQSKGEKQLHVPTPLEWYEAGHRTSETYRFFYDVGCGPDMFTAMGPTSPIQGVLFDPFRRLGFAIWSTERMCGYGFLQPEFERRYLYEDCLYAAWRSVLSVEEIAALEQKSFEWYEAENAQDNYSQPRIFFDC